MLDSRVSCWIYLTICLSSVKRLLSDRFDGLVGCVGHDRNPRLIRTMPQWNFHGPARLEPAPSRTTHVMTPRSVLCRGIGAGLVAISCAVFAAQPTATTADFVRVKKS